MQDRRSAEFAVVRLTCSGGVRTFARSVELRRVRPVPENPVQESCSIFTATDGISHPRNVARHRALPFHVLQRCSTPVIVVRSATLGEVCVF